LKPPFTEWPAASTLGRSGDDRLAGRFARALAAGGLACAEITFRTPRAAEALRRISAELRAERTPREPLRLISGGRDEGRQGVATGDFHSPDCSSR